MTFMFCVKLCYGIIRLFTDQFILCYSDYLFKLLLIGDSGVGKSCLLLRFAVSSCFICSYDLYVSLPFPFVGNKEGVFAMQFSYGRQFFLLLLLFLHCIYLKLSFLG